MTSNGHGTNAPQLNGSLEAIYKFSRPHTVRGTLLAAISGCLRAILEGGFFVSKSLVFRAILGVVALILRNVFIVGINQVYDIEVDKVNKPFLPLAAQQMEVPFAWLLVVSSGIVGVAITRLYFSRLIFYLYIAGLGCGALYSVPPFRWRRWPWMAAITISFVRGFLLNFGVYHATKSALGIPFQWNPVILFTACFMTIYACVIALAKDLPDVQGDKQYRVETFAARMGVDKVVRLVVALLLFDYIFAILTALVAPAGTFRRHIMLWTHIGFAFWWIQESKRVQTNSKPSLLQFYRSIWNLFYAEYCVLPFL
jgi:homogentisate solanesyltransferase